MRVSLAYLACDLRTSWATDVEGRATHNDPHNIVAGRRLWCRALLRGLSGHSDAATPALVTCFRPGGEPPRPLLVGSARLMEMLCGAGTRHPPPPEHCPSQPAILQLREGQPCSPENHPDDRSTAACVWPAGGERPAPSRSDLFPITARSTLRLRGQGGAGQPLGALVFVHPMRASYC